VILSFRDINIKPEYRSLRDNIVRDFYYPVLRNSVLYQRSVGYFSSTALIELSRGLSGLLENEGRIQLVASPALTADDVLAIEEGYQQRESILLGAAFRELKIHHSQEINERLNYVAHLIAMDKLDLKIAIVTVNSIGIYHEKLGIFTDSDGNRIAFSGSMNETKSGFSHNYESIDTFRSWTDEDSRVDLKTQSFNAIWNNSEIGIETLKFKEIDQEIMQRYKKDKVSISFDEKYSSPEKDHKLQNFEIPEEIELYDYQQEAIEAWKLNQYIGLFNMATGSGKTITALSALQQIRSDLANNLVVIILCPFQHLVEQWVDDLYRFCITPIIGYSSSRQKNWKNKLERAIRNNRIGVRGSEFFCFISTNATFATESVQRLLSRIRSDILLIADEVHNLGTLRLSDLLLPNYNYRLGLSATIDRHGDPEGTCKLYDFFNSVVYEYGLERAIEEGKLTPYFYYPVFCTLSQDELDRYHALSRQINEHLLNHSDGTVSLDTYGKILAIDRSKLIAGAVNKIERLKELLSQYVNKNKILIYCGVADIDSSSIDNTNLYQEEIRQIDYITKLLGNNYGMKVAQFTSKETIIERTRLKNEFAKGENLQALIAIKCLDEGMNIPSIEYAFILASTTNPKEYIQRRGRVLRKSLGKKYSYIFDFVVLPRKLEEVYQTNIAQVKIEQSLVFKELKRAKEFARIAENSSEIDFEIDKIKAAYNIPLELYERQEEANG
jgi:superfamily II DNA or RNA helicase